MVQRPKLNSTGRVTTSGWDPGGARREMADLKARSKGGKKKKKDANSLCVTSTGSRRIRWMRT